MQKRSNNSIPKEISELDFKKIQINVKVAKDRIQQQYSERCFAFQKEAIQNSWDARFDKKNGKGWHLEISVNSKNRTIVVEDFGTIGIENWNNYLTLWDSSKTEDSTAGGTMGQGKMTLLLGNYMITESYVKSSKEYKFVIHTEDGRITEEVPSNWQRGIYHAGTKITVFNIPADVLIEFSNTNKMIRDIQLAWSEIIENFGKAIIYRYDDSYFQVPSLEKPALAPDSSTYSSSKIDLKFKKNDGKNETISIYNFEMNYCVSNTNPDLEGVAINVNQQTIKRYKPSTLRTLTGGVLVGSCSVPQLRFSQLANHCDFITTDLKWKAVKAKLDEEISKYVEPFRKKTKINKAQRQMFNKLVDQINEILAKYPEIPLLFSRRKKSIPKDETIYLGKLKITAPQHLKKGEDLGLNVHLKHSHRKNDLIVTVLIEDPIGTEEIKTYRAGKEEHLIQVDIPGEIIQMEGRYFVIVKAEDKEEGKSEIKRTSFKIGKKITRRKKSRSTTSVPKYQGIDTIRPFRSSELKREAFFLIEEGVIVVNLLYPTIIKAISLKKVKEKSLLIVRASISALVDEIIKLEIKNIKTVSGREEKLQELIELNDKMTSDWYESFGSG